MLNFKNTLIFFSAVLVILMAVDFLLPVSFWIYTGIILVLVIILAWGAGSIQSGFYITSVCRGDRNVKSISLTFDDGPDGQITPMILDILKENNVKATFFIVGRKAEKHPEIIKRIDKEGHIIGGHSYSHHFFFDFFSSERMKREMKHTDQLVHTITGRKLRLFRPPYGVTNPPVARSVMAMQYQTIGWSLKSNDTVINEESLLLNNLTTNLKRGDIILFHDNKPLTAKVLKPFIQFSKERGFAVIRLDEFLNCKAYVY